MSGDDIDFGPDAMITARSDRRTVAVQKVAESTLEGGAVAVLHLDVRRMSWLSEVYGEAQGDRLLDEIERQGSKIEGVIWIQRGRGDEFVVAFRPANHSGMAHAELIVRSLVENVRITSLGGRGFSIRFAVGMSTCEHADGASEAIRGAWLAAEVNRRDTRDLVVEYKADDVRFLQRHRVAALVRRVDEALSSGGLTLAIQPIVDLRGGERRIVKGEFLMRAPKLGYHDRAPVDLLEAARSVGCIHDLDMHVAKLALEWMASNADAVNRLAAMQINLTAETVSDPVSMAELEGHVVASGVDPRKILWEVTEEAGISALDVACGSMQGLKALGCRFALDDFGVGHSSMAYLDKLPVDEIKIDGVFVKGMQVSEKQRFIIQSMVQLAHSMGIKTTAEMIESRVAEEALVDMGVDYGQGWHYWRAIQPTEFKAAVLSGNAGALAA